MNIKRISTLLLCGSLNFFPCKSPAPRMIPRNIPTKIENDHLFHELLADTFSIKYSDKEKIIQFNKLQKKYHKKNDNYIIIDKKECEAYVYNADGDLLVKEEVGLGRHIGDNRCGGYKHPDLKQAYTTPPGEFCIKKIGSAKGSSNEILYGNKVMLLRGDHTLKESKRFQTLALHQIPLRQFGQRRVFAFNNNTLKDNRMSYGCINFLSDSFDKIRANIKGISTKVYILPEETNNSLYIEKEKNGSYKFFQKKYRYEYLENADINKNKN